MKVKIVKYFSSDGEWVPTGIFPISYHDNKIRKEWKRLFSDWEHPPRIRIFKEERVITESELEKEKGFLVIGISKKKQREYVEGKETCPVCD